MPQMLKMVFYLLFQCSFLKGEKKNEHYITMVIIIITLFMSKNHLYFKKADDISFQFCFYVLVSLEYNRYFVHIQGLGETSPFRTSKGVNYYSISKVLLSNYQLLFIIMYLFFSCVSLKQLKIFLIGPIICVQLRMIKDEIIRVLKDV